MDMDVQFLSNVMGSSAAKGKRSKRLRPCFSGEEQEGPWSWIDSTEEDEHESEDEEIAAHSLMLLSHDLSFAATRFPTPIKRVMTMAKEFHSADSPCDGEKRTWYKCKTCSKAFLSFQALGGHRASCCHSSNLADSEHANEKSSTSNKMKVHQCTICCRVFSSGQALGGHKRTHSTPPPPTHSSATENEYEQRAELDLNMPPPLDETENSSALPLSTVVRPNCKAYEMSPLFCWMTSSGKRVPSVYNGHVVEEAENEVLVSRALRFRQDLVTVAPVN